MEPQKRKSSSIKLVQSDGKEKYQKYRTLRIDEAGQLDEDDEDTFLGRSTYSKQNSPKDIEEHLLAKDDNMLHFKAMLKYYGVNSSVMKLPDCAEKALDEKYQVKTPDAQVQSISASQRDKHEFIKMLVAEIMRLKSEISVS